MASGKLRITTVHIDDEDHNKVRALLITKKLPYKGFSEWVRAKEAEAVKGMK